MTGIDLPSIGIAVLGSILVLLVYHAVIRQRA